FAGNTPTDIGNDGSIDTIYAADGSFSVVVDGNGDVHAAFPILRVIKDGTSAGYSYFALTSRMVYYKGTSTLDTLILVDDIFDGWHDCDKINSVNFGDSYTTTPDGDAAYNTIGLLTQPSISIVPGAPQKVLIAYTSVMDNDTTVDDGVHQYWFGSSSIEGQPYRDVLVVGSQDNGDTWTYPVNVSKTAHFEEAFVSTPEIINGTKFPIFYQGDIEPGTILQNLDTYDPDFQNFMILQQVDIADIFSKGADSTSICDQFDLPLGTKDVVNGTIGLVNVFPNPSTDFINVSMKFVNTANNVILEVTDIAGNTVYSTQLKNVLEDSQKIAVSSFAQGVYVIKVTTDNGTITRKFVKD
ncbi:MAG TPA: T9SS type A sorting domain-containing protein, partial [Chitinophagaceae bacterium]|nr:T9SS type A sorting domain-containing protein [Chitinophagaceae bacterium]